MGVTISERIPVLNDIEKERPPMNNGGAVVPPKGDRRPVAVAKRVAGVVAKGVAFCAVTTRVRDPPVQGDEVTACTESAGSTGSLGDGTEYYRSAVDAGFGVVESILWVFESILL